MALAMTEPAGGRHRSTIRASGALSLRARLVLLAVACVLPPFVFGLGREYMAYRDAVASTGEQTLALARSMSLVVDEELRTRIVALEMLSRSSALRSGNIGAFRARAEAVIAQQFPGSGVLVLRADGQPVMNTAPPSGEPLPARASTTTVREVFAGERPVVSDLFLGMLSNRPAVMIEIPVNREDQGVGYTLALTPRLDDFADIIGRQHPPEGWVVSILDRQGVVVARWPSTGQFVGEKATPDLLAQLRQAPEGISDSRSLEGVPTLVVYSRAERFGWTVAIGVPRAQLMTPALRRGLITLATGGALLLASFALVLFVVRQISRPIAALRRLAAAPDGDAWLGAPRTGLPEADAVLHAMREAEGRRRRSEAEEHRARAALQASEDRLRQSQKMESIGQLTGGLAHDFNNLLLVILGNLGLLQDVRPSDPEIQELAQEARDAAQRGAELTRSLLAFGRRQPLRPQRVDVRELVDGITKLLGRTLGERIEISLDLPGDAWSVMVDPVQLQAALVNLAANARDAMPEGGRLTITATNQTLDKDAAGLHADATAGDYVMLAVADAGKGMTPDIVAQIFEPFFTTKPRAEGSGLGLSMVFGFVKQSGGHIGVDSEPGVGTTMRLYLPRDHQGAERDESGSAQAAPRGGGETVLVVEDDAAIRRLVVRQLTDLGYRVQQAESADDAIALLEGGVPIDVVFSDVLMPGKLDGHDLAQIVRERWPSSRVILTSGFSGADIDRNARRSSGVRLLNKPYVRDDLARILREVLNQRERSHEPA
jgi:signal transduction histidine kinase/ActR/RegA family two-component response regulator